MPPIDDLGIEHSDTVAEALKDPKSTVLAEVFDYFDRRKHKKAELEEIDRKKHDKKKGFFDGFISD